jgi:hypothetical protein
MAVFGTLIFLNIGVIIAGRVRSRGGRGGRGERRHAADDVPQRHVLPRLLAAGAPWAAAVQALPLTHMLSAMRGSRSTANQWPRRGQSCSS